MSLLLVAILVSQLNVTDGEIVQRSSRLVVTSKEMRAVLATVTKQEATLTFTYLGPPAEVSHLGNGEVRRQFGFKLQAQDPCNLLYAIWDFDHSTLRVSVKRNPSHTSNECRDNGYTGLVPVEVKRLPEVKIGEEHIFHVKLDSGELTVDIDSVVVWRGQADVKWRGPLGLRSDNVQVIFDLQVAQ